MNTGQSLMSIGALLLLSITVLRINNSILYSDEVMNGSKYAMMANSIATSLLEKASRTRADGQSMHFDENTILNQLTDSTQLTPPNSLTTETGEVTEDQYDDIDDYNGYTQQDVYYGSVTFYSRCEVCYVMPNNPDGKLNNFSWHKKLSVSVTWRQNNEPIGFAPDTIKQSTIYSYWWYAR
jgi:hypothetical protein